MNSLQKPHILNPQPYRGQSTQLIIGIDVGTSYSGVCYAFLRPGEVPEVQSVTRFTDQTSGDNKIPSVMYYDASLELQAAGATAVSENVVHEAEYEEWTRLQYFKMHMRPSNMVIDTHGLEIEPLPSGKNVTEVMGDFLHYLYKETMAFIEDHHVESDLLEKVKNRTSFVLSHPNGWTGLPQQRMREAAIKGGLVKDNADGRAKIEFVSEGEASAISCIAGGLCPPDLKPGYRFIIADVGGGTIDITSYEVTQSSPLKLKELTSSDCRFAGSVFVNIMAKKLLQKKLRGSAYDNPVLLDEIVNGAFESSIKREFRDASRAAWLRVGDRNENDNDANLGIRKGSLRLEGRELASCFDFSIAEASKSIKAQITACGGKPMPVWLVGGFSASPWIFKRLKEEFGRNGIVIGRPDIDSLSKAVARGNVLFSLEKIVTSRVTRNAYGVQCSNLYCALNSEHYRRQHLRCTALDGKDLINGQFSTIVDRNVDVVTETRSSHSYLGLTEDSQDAFLSENVFSYDGEEPVPMWYDGNEDKFRTSCNITADLSALCTPATRKTHNGNTFWQLEFEIEISFGLTELQARVKWVEKGKTKYGPATIFYEE